MKLYHGTSEKVAKEVLKVGLLPRRRRKGNWKHTVNSRPDAVYLTDIYGPYFAWATTDEGRAAILEVETDRLDPSRFMPDEDFLEQATRGRNGSGYANPKLPLKERNLYYRRIAEFNRDLWDKSLSALGTVAYQWSIPTSAITRVAYFELDHPMALDAAEAMICLENHKIMAEKYRHLTKYFFGEPIEVSDYDIYGQMFTPEQVESLPEEFRKMVIDRREYLEEKLSDRSGLEVEHLS